jgi:glutamate N-acetyltransferase/amino-acid N-acetyltransferase
MADFQWLEGGITAVPGLLASGIAAGIKPSGKKDLALIYSSSPARAAAVFTTNQVKGASVTAAPRPSSPPPAAPTSVPASRG